MIQIAIVEDEEIYVKQLTFTKSWACGHFFRPLCLYSFYNLED